LLDACGIPTGESDSGLIVLAVDSLDAADQFVAAIAKHRHFARETDPPRV
jgi:catalase